MTKPEQPLTGAGMDTLAVRAGTCTTVEGEHSEALFLTSSYVFRDSKEAAARFSGEQPGNVYSRYSNPTVRAFEERLAAMEERSEDHTSELQSRGHLVCRLLLEKKK